MHAGCVDGYSEATQPLGSRAWLEILLVGLGCPHKYRGHEFLTVREAGVPGFQRGWVLAGFEGCPHQRTTLVYVYGHRPVPSKPESTQTSELVISEKGIPSHSRAPEGSREDSDELGLDHTPIHLCGRQD